MTKAFWRLSAPVFLVLTMPMVANAASSDPPMIAPDGGPWGAGDGFKFERKEKKTRQAMFDEGSEARYLVIRDKSYSIENERVVLRPGNVELDAEGAATDGRFYYVTGSHSAKRKNCANNPDSRYVARFRVDANNGRALRDPAGNPDGRLAEFDNTDRLWMLMKTILGLKDHVGDNMCLGTEPPEEGPHAAGKRGVNIEGLAIKDGRLFFGFRGPAIDGAAKILAVNADTLFTGGDTNPKLSAIAVGQGRAIRDLHAVSDGILVLVGPDDDEKNKNAGWVVARWSGQDTGDAIGQLKPLARLDLSRVEKRPCDDEDRKPEGLAVIDDHQGKPYRVVIFSDGMCDGGPLDFTIPR